MFEIQTKKSDALFKRILTTFPQSLAIIIGRAVFKSQQLLSYPSKMTEDTAMIRIGANPDRHPVELNPAMANRHGLVAGATGTGKTVTLQVLAEQFSKLGVPVFAADVKGDLSGIAAPGSELPKISERLELIELDAFAFEPSPVAFWDMHGRNGVPLRTTISEVGPLLLSNILELNSIQSDVMQVAFRVADENGLLLLDLKDLQELFRYIGDTREEVSKQYGNVSTQTIAAIQRRLLVLEESGGDQFFGEPALVIKDLLQSDFSGRGVIHLLQAKELIQDPRLYSTFLVWLLSELFEELEEVGDREKPRFVLFFDEAHLLFEFGSEPLKEKFEQVVRLIRSKGVALFFVTQHPSDLPEGILSQLGTKILHGLRAFSPKEKKLITTISESLPSKDPEGLEQVITELRVGEAVISTLDEDGVPTDAARTLIRPPASRIGPVQPELVGERVESSPFLGKYGEAVDRESAYELLLKRREELEKEAEKAEKEKKSSRRQGAFETFFKSVVRTVGYQLGKAISRGILGSIKR